MREGVLEFLLINIRRLPICDQAGECKTAGVFRSITENQKAALSKPRFTNPSRIDLGRGLFSMTNAAFSARVAFALPKKSLATIALRHRNRGSYIL